MDGHGLLVWKDGKQYEGNFVNGIRNGRGHYTYDGRLYEGNFVNNTRDGLGF